jgi:hypothetical protein
VVLPQRTQVRGAAPQNDLTAFGRSAWEGVAPDLWTTANAGKTWRTVKIP